MRLGVDVNYFNKLGQWPGAEFPRRFPQGAVTPQRRRGQSFPSELDVRGRPARFFQNEFVLRRGPRVPGDELVALGAIVSPAPMYLTGGK